VSHALASREGIVGLLRKATALVALVPAESIYGERVPEDRTYPFIRVEVPDIQPFRTACFAAGEQSRHQVSAFVRGASMDGAALVGEQIKQALDGRTIDLPGGTGTVTFEGGQIVRDPEEPDCWHSLGFYVVT